MYTYFFLLYMWAPQGWKPNLWFLLLYLFRDNNIVLLTRYQAISIYLPPVSNFQQCMPIQVESDAVMGICGIKRERKPVMAKSSPVSLLCQRGLVSREAVLAEWPRIQDRDGRKESCKSRLGLERLRVETDWFREYSFLSSLNSRWLFFNICRTQAGVHKVSLMVTSLVSFIGVFMFLA